MNYKSKTLSVRDVDPEIFKEFKAEAVKEGMQVGKALNWAMEIWIHTPRKKPKMSMAKFKPSDWGKGTERLSEQVDEIVYGGD